MTSAIIEGAANMFRWNFRWLLGVALALSLGACKRTFDCSALAQQGSSVVAIREVRLPDPGRGIEVRVRVVAPEHPDAATFLVPLSIGMTAEITDFDPLARFLAASNYAVAVIEHRSTTLQQVCGTTTGLECWKKSDEAETHPEIWFDRFSDLALVLDRLPGVLGIDGTRAALVGHSFGAFTAMAYGGTTFVDPRTKVRHDLRDPRVVAVAAMSPQGPRWFGLDEDSWKTIDRPLLLLTGDHDGSDLPDDSAEWRRESFATMHGGDKLMLRIADADHMSFTARAKRADIADLVRRMTLAFLDATLRIGDRGTSLSAKEVMHCSGGQASLERH